MQQHAGGGRGDALAWALAIFVPFLLYVATASGYAYWLDSGEFVAAASDLGIAHPPGEVLATLTHFAACLLPFGSMALRVALVSAAFASLASGIVYHAARTTLAAAGLPPSPSRAVFALSASWLFAACYGVWLQAVRPEVYGLQSALVLFALDRLLTYEARRPSSDPRPLYAASVAFGLGLANHHFLAFLLLPAAAPTLARLVRERGPRPLWRIGLFALPGLSTFLYLPLRAAANPMLNLGEPTTPSRLFWVISAEAFQKNQGAAVPHPLGVRAADVVMALVESLHPATVLVALLGAWILLRARATLRLAVLWLGVVATYATARAWLGFVDRNPDALGYLMPALAGLSVLATAGLAVVYDLLRRGGRAARLLSLVALLAGPVLVTRTALATAPRVSLASFHDTDAFDDGLRRALPTRSVVLAHQAQTLFRYWGGEAQELARPDVTVVPIPFLTYPGMVNHLVTDHPELGDLLRGYLLEGSLEQPDLQTLAAQRPLLIEMDTRVSPALYETLAPQDLYLRVFGGGASRGDERAGRARRERIWRTIDADLGRPLDPETHDQLLWRRYMETLYFAGFGDRDAARASCDAGLGLDPEARELLGLREALLPTGAPGEDERPLDVEPYRLGAASE